MYNALHLIQLAEATTADRLRTAERQRSEATVEGRAGPVGRFRHGLGHGLIVLGHRLAHGSTGSFH